MHHSSWATGMEKGRARRLMPELHVSVHLRVPPKVPEKPLRWTWCQLCKGMSAFGVPTQTHCISHRLGNSANIAAIPQGTTGGAILFLPRFQKGIFAAALEDHLVHMRETVTSYCPSFRPHAHIKFSLLHDVTFGIRLRL